MEGDEARKAHARSTILANPNTMFFDVENTLTENRPRQLDVAWPYEFVRA